MERIIRQFPDFFSDSALPILPISLPIFSSVSDFRQFGIADFSISLPIFNIGSDFGNLALPIFTRLPILNKSKKVKDEF
ncbi:hypothetical protein [Mariniflexile maritimum]|uniref:hypothetical protein n=1 Tax=Mariniflexile maritimum TaxID=2682493 RepID=UPI0012F6B8C5|nr:hypothetical protein [Mariniflexile maritimum]